tara:strand:+ start:6752 stop:8170 length:1419 start_codon:yes stop_codon:yes gene_type:complete
MGKPKQISFLNNLINSIVNNPLIKEIMDNYGNMLCVLILSILALHVILKCQQKVKENFQGKVGLEKTETVPFNTIQKIERGSAEVKIYQTYPDEGKIIQLDKDGDYYYLYISKDTSTYYLSLETGNDEFLKNPIDLTSMVKDDDTLDKSKQEEVRDLLNIPSNLEFDIVSNKKDASQFIFKETETLNTYKIYATLGKKIHRDYTFSYYFPIKNDSGNLKSNIIMPSGDDNEKNIENYLEGASELTITTGTTVAAVIKPESVKLEIFPNQNKLTLHFEVENQDNIDNFLVVLAKYDKNKKHMGHFKVHASKEDDDDSHVGQDTLQGKTQMCIKKDNRIKCSKTFIDIDHVDLNGDVLYYKIGVAAIDIEGNMFKEGFVHPYNLPGGYPFFVMSKSVEEMDRFIKMAREDELLKTSPSLYEAAVSNAGGTYEFISKQLGGYPDGLNLDTTKNTLNELIDKSMSLGQINVNVSSD